MDGSARAKPNSPAVLAGGMAARAPRGKCESGDVALETIDARSEPLEADGGVDTLPSDDAGDGVAECEASGVSGRRSAGDIGGVCSPVPCAERLLDTTVAEVSIVSVGGAARCVAGEREKSDSSFLRKTSSSSGGTLSCHSRYPHISRSI